MTSFATPFAAPFALVLGALAVFNAHAAAAAVIPDTVAAPAACLGPYPAEAQRRQQEGVVVVDMQVRPDGSVLDTKLARTSWYPRLDQATLEAAARCKNLPPSIGGDAAPRWVPTAFAWKLPQPMTWKAAAAPQELRDFFARARAADAIADPLKRCLAFPDYPGSTWPATATRALCHDRTEQGVTLRQLDEHLRANTLAAFEDKLRADLERHYSTTDFSEIIHKDFNIFDASADADRLSAAWLAAMPDSAFALAARGRFLHSRIWAVRGNAGPATLGSEAVEKMGDMARESTTLLQRALKADPRILPAIEALIDLAKVTGDGIDMQFALGASDRADRSCFPIAVQRMSALSPRWGGSYPEMKDYAAMLKTLAPARPLLHSLQHAIQVEEAEVLARDTANAEAVNRLRAAVRAAPSRRAGERLADLMMTRSQNSWETLATLLSAYRFSPGTGLQAKERARLLLEMGDPAWARASAEYARALLPADPQASMLLADALNGMGEPELAAPFVQEALREPTMRQTSAYTIVKGKRASQQLPEADSASLAYVKEYPEDPLGWIERGLVLDQLGNRAEADAAFARVRAFDDGKGKTMRMRFDTLEQYLKGARPAATPAR